MLRYLQNVALVWIIHATKTWKHKVIEIAIKTNCKKIIQKTEFQIHVSFNLFSNISHLEMST